MRNTPWLALCLSLTLLGGCATYGDEVGGALRMADAGEYEAARESLSEVLDPEGDDRLLYHLEQGVIAHLAGDYQQSIDYLLTAEDIGDALYTRYFSDAVRAALSHPRNAPYRGTAYELAYIHYFQALNFTHLAQQSDDRVTRRRHLDSALVETRRLDARLRELMLLEGDYQEAAADREANRMSGLLQAFHGISADISDPNLLQFREAAWLRYLSGVLYEKAGDLDDARIAYQRAAELYEEGYAQQFAIDEGMVDRAWRDAFRMEAVTGNWSAVAETAEQRLGESAAQGIRESDSDTAHVVVIQHVDRLPPRGELNLVMYADPRRRSVTLQPVAVGSYEEQMAQEIWFRALYADTGPLGWLTHFSQGGLEGLIRGSFEKSFYIGPFWGQLESLGLVDALRGGVRVAVPYPGPPRPPPPPAKLWVGEGQHVFQTADNLTYMAYQDLLMEAGEELRRAVARELLRHSLASLAARELEEEFGTAGLLLGLFARAGTSATVRADTRAWQGLPAAVRVVRLELPPGEHELRLSSGRFMIPEGGESATVRLTVSAGDVHVLQARRISHRHDLLPPLERNEAMIRLNH
ncbi:tetratricopeptide (TPR) repeat protein [Natronospira proteinivora]|uniref:Tetratricopeptide (TPR) repeat protein n=1 Tax=Natronospira proteinivora TaxID=1807133 RepID=A0ABT1G9I5_9GAMM|nr:hypothetical protein [Natronospira proteinivora]MCP1727965.1 tetratricopeptide (TPR) repeat protein [Natronospira proteinivora]